jgi:S-DNA-T family DNA segregation ATPase FtsK/SpoIIIE
MLTSATEEGIPVPGLIKATDMSRRWVYYQLNGFAKADRAVQVSRGRWRATDSEDHST